MNGMEKRYYSPNEMNRLFGVPIVMLRREIRAGNVPGFYSGKWYHVDGPAYLEQLSNHNEFPADTAR